MAAKNIEKKDEVFFLKEERQAIKQSSCGRRLRVKFALT